MVVATRLDFIIALASVALVFAMGGFAGIAAGFFGGWTDRIVGRISDTIMAFPLFVLAMGIVAALGNTVTNIVIATAIINFPLYVRVARAEANVRREAGFVQAARLSGNGDFRILLMHILPNIMPIMMVQISLTMGYAILNAAGPVVHRPRRQTADAGMGDHGGGRRRQHHFRRMVDRAVSRRGADDRGVLLQPSGRRLARSGRPAAAGHERSWRRSPKSTQAEQRSADTSLPLLDVQRSHRRVRHPARHRARGEHVNITVAKGETLGIVGESGLRQVGHVLRGDAHPRPRRQASPKAR